MPTKHPPTAMSSAQLTYGCRAVEVVRQLPEEDPHALDRVLHEEGSAWARKKESGRCKSMK